MGSSSDGFMLCTSTVLMHIAAATILADRCHGHHSKEAMYVENPVLPPLKRHALD